MAVVHTTAPRWSHGGRRIVYVSNETGDLQLVVQDVLGGARTRVELPERPT